MKTMSQTAQLKLSWEEIGFLCEGMSFASRPMELSVKDINEEYGLGPRGAWITILIASGQMYPLSLAEIFRVGRSLITAELTRLADAGLIEYAQSAEDGRRVELRLTSAGNAVQRRVRDQLSKLVLRRLQGYRREDVLLCAQILRDFWAPKDEHDGKLAGSPSEQRRAKSRRAPDAVSRRRRRPRQSA